MLQIFGWLGCVYLFVKGFEFIGNEGYRETIVEDGKERRKVRLSALVALVTSWFGAIVFVFVLNYQASQMPGQPSLSMVPEFSSFSDCLNHAKTADEIKGCEKYMTH